jgi:hypothetical protein
MTTRIRTNPHVIAENQRRNRHNDEQELRGLIGDIGIRRSRDPNSPFYYDFRVPNSNEQGQSAVVSTRIKPGLDRFLRIVLSHRLIPHHTVSDILRHALAEYAYKIGYMIEHDTVPETSWSAVFKVEKFKEEREYRRKELQGMQGIGKMVTESRGNQMEMAAMREFIDDQLVHWTDREKSHMRDEVLKLVEQYDEQLQKYEREIEDD